MLLILTRRRKRRMQFNPFMTGMLVSVAIASISQVLLKKSTFVHYQSIIKEYINPYVIGGYGLLFISMLLTVYAYSGMDYKYGPVIEAFGNVFVLVLSSFLNLLNCNMVICKYANLSCNFKCFLCNFLC